MGLSETSGDIRLAKFLLGPGSSLVHRLKETEAAAAAAAVAISKGGDEGKGGEAPKGNGDSNADANMSHNSQQVKVYAYVVNTPMRSFFARPFH